MKKTVSILLALTMLFALCVPSFAAAADATPKASTTTTITQTDVPTPGKKEATVSVLPEKAGGTAVSATFEITIPASVDLYWEDAGKFDMGYTVNSHILEAGKKLTVSVSAAENGLMKSGTNGQLNGNSDTLQLVKADTASNLADLSECTKEYTGSNTTAESPVSLPVQVQTFENKTIDTYKNTFTYTVTYTPVA